MVNEAALGWATLPVKAVLTRVFRGHAVHLASVLVFVALRLTRGGKTPGAPNGANVGAVFFVAGAARHRDLAIQVADAPGAVGRTGVRRGRPVKVRHGP